MRYTSNPVRDIDADNDERQRKSENYDRNLAMWIDVINMNIAHNDQKTVNDIEEELIHSDAIVACLYVRETQGKDAAWQALDDAIYRAIERVAARRVKE